ncbi:MAG: DNA polymerase/3'-5' exonuclease PolX [Phycisphaerales bacterium]|nr:DNA polymerase/3'-5' exonuclease PolX [Phycisphaerales bacterium]
MARTKADILDMFHELSELTILEEGDPASFRVRAYESAARAVDAYVGDVTALTAAKLQALEGIGKSSAAKIRELVDTGKVEKLEDLRKKHPPAIVALLAIPGLGPKAVNRLRKELGVQGLDDLRRVIAEHKLRDLKGFGQKSEDKIAQALARMQKQGTQGRTPISVALPLAERILATIEGIAGVRKAAYCGSLRRFAETIGDLDFLVAADDPGKVMDTVVALSMVDQVLGRGETKTSVVTRRGLQIDVRVVKEEELGAALMYFTGSKAHNVKMRQRALARGLTLNEYALTEIATGKVVAARTEEDVYAALGLPWIPPHLREDTGEIELAEQNALPAPVPRILGDFHVHTTVSGDGKSSLEEQIAAARARGVARSRVQLGALPAQADRVARGAVGIDDAHRLERRRRGGPLLPRHGLDHGDLGRVEVPRLDRPVVDEGDAAGGEIRAVDRDRRRARRDLALRDVRQARAREREGGAGAGAGVPLPRAPRGGDRGDDRSPAPGAHQDRRVLHDAALGDAAENRADEEPAPAAGVDDRERAGYAAGAGTARCGQTARDDGGGLGGALGGCESV